MVFGKHENIQLLCRSFFFKTRACLAGLRCSRQHERTRTGDFIEVRVLANAHMAKDSWCVVREGHFWLSFDCNAKSTLLAA